MGGCRRPFRGRTSTTVIQATTHRYALPSTIPLALICFILYNIHMGKGQFLGEFEQVVLLAVLRLEAGAYGVTVRQEIEDRVGRVVSIGAVYATVNRLEEKGYLESYGTDPIPVRGGRARRHFKLTREGVNELRASRNMLGLLWDGIDLDTHSSAV